jgi:hypothetical protein
MIVFSENILKDNENNWKYFYKILNKSEMKIKGNLRNVSSSKFRNAYVCDIIEWKNISFS